MDWYLIFLIIGIYIQWYQLLFFSFYFSLIACVLETLYPFLMKNKTKQKQPPPIKYKNFSFDLAEEISLETFWSISNHQIDMSAHHWLTLKLGYINFFHYIMHTEEKKYINLIPLNFPWSNIEKIRLKKGLEHILSTWNLIAKSAYLYVYSSISRNNTEGVFFLYSLLNLNNKKNKTLANHLEKNLRNADIKKIKKYSESVFSSIYQNFNKKYTNEFIKPLVGNISKKNFFIPTHRKSLYYLKFLLFSFD